MRGNPSELAAETKEKKTAVLCYSHIQPKAINIHKSVICVQEIKAADKR